MFHNYQQVSGQLYHDLEELAFEDAQQFLERIAKNQGFLTRELLPLLQGVRPSSEPYIAATYGTREATTCMQIFVWPAGATTPIHDHTAWGAYKCVIGRISEDRYERLDDGSQPNTARLRKRWRRAWSSRDGASTVGPYEAGIHRVGNPGWQTSISIHLYGPRLGAFDGRDYDLFRDSVCDRLEIGTPGPS